MHYAGAGELDDAAIGLPNAANAAAVASASVTDSRDDLGRKKDNRMRQKPAGDDGIDGFGG
jgi:hypothetical protein